MHKYDHLVAGQPMPADLRFQTSDPSDTRNAVAAYGDGGKPAIDAAVAAAVTAYSAWSATTPVARGRLLSKASQAIEARRDELASLLTAEEGKTLAEATGEVQRAADIFRFFGGLGYTLGGHTIPHDLPDNLLFTKRESLGVVGLITPWNFPIAIPVWKLAPALLCGNTVVLKPSPIAPAMAFEVAKILADAGLPPGVLNVVTGQGAAAGQALAAHPDVIAVSFTGSFAVGSQVYQSLSTRMARAQMEMGGKNPTIVLADGDLDLAATLIARAGFGLTGQACTATSRVIVDRSVASALTEKLIAKARALKVGPGIQLGVEMGPVVNRAQLDRIQSHVARAKEQGAKLLTGGDTLNGHPHGLFFQPTIFGDVDPEMAIARDEVFGPVLTIQPVDGFDAAIDLANSLDVGLSASLVTRDLRKAMLYADRIRAGVVKVNQISTGLALQAPFGGTKRSGTDTLKEQGPAAVDFYSRIKTIYVDYSVG